MRSTFHADTYQRAARATREPLSLYLHIPFCHSLCYYCGCNKIVTRNSKRVKNYLEHLVREIALQGDLFENSPVTQLHLGGGTPTYLEQDQLAYLAEALDQHFKLAPTEIRESSIEVDPRTVTCGDIAQLAGLGFNRLSLGIQDFDPEVQTAINRLQSVSQVSELVRAARDNGFKSVSFDLIYGLPLQTPRRFARTLAEVLLIRPDRLAIYNYAHLPERFRSQRLIRDQDLPAPGEKLTILGETIATLAQAGYRHIGMDHFALPDDDLAIAAEDGTLQRNFQGYSTHGGCELVAMGISAISKVGNCYSQNTLSTREYGEHLERGDLPIIKGMTVDEDDQRRARVIQDIMCRGKVEFSTYFEQFGIDFSYCYADELEALRPLQIDGLVEVTPTGFRVGPRGKFLLRNIAMVFDRHLSSPESTSSFSRAI